MVGAGVCSLVAALGFTLLALGGSAEAGTTGDANGLVYQPDSKPFGMTYGEWAGTWWQWVLGIPKNVSPFLDTNGAQCGSLQQGPVWFLAGTSGPLASAVRECSIPAGQAILIPIVTFLNDYPCPIPPPPGAPFEPAPGQSIEAFLTAGATGVVDTAGVLEAEIDGKPVRNLTAYRATSRMIQFTAAKDLDALDACITGSPQVGVADGYWLMLKPLSVGRHTLHIKGDSTEATYHLTIVHR
jgi:hypothetical protein